jgi:hypothetical protein
MRRGRKVRLHDCIPRTNMVEVCPYAFRRHGLRRRSTPIASGSTRQCRQENAGRWMDSILKHRVRWKDLSRRVQHRHQLRQLSRQGRQAGQKMGTRPPRLEGYDAVLGRLLVLACIGRGPKDEDEGLEGTVDGTTDLAGHRLSAHVLARREAVRAFGLQAIIIRF